AVNNFDVWASASNDVWLVTSSGGAHYDGATWAPYVTSVGGQSVWGRGPRDVWAAYPTIWRYDGQDWMTVPSSTTDVSNFVTGNALDVWTITNSAGASTSHLLRGGTWTDFPNALHFAAVGSLPSGQAWAVGPAGLIDHFGGQTWEP